MNNPTRPRPEPPIDTPPVPRADLAVAAVAVILAVVALVASNLQSGFAPLITLTLTPPGVAPADGGMIIVVTPTPVVLPGVQMGAAIAVLLLFVAAMRLLLLVPALRRRHATDAAADRHTWRWIEYSQLAGVGTFLVAQLNGITEVTSLVPIYALGAAGALFLIVHDHRSPEVIRYHGGQRTRLRPRALTGGEYPKVPHLGVPVEEVRLNPGRDCVDACLQEHPAVVSERR